VNDHAEGNLRKERFKTRAIADVDVVVRKALSGSLQPRKVPGCVTGGTEECTPHIIVNAMNDVSAAIIIFNRSGAY
jgi:hypothetical protein